MKHLELFPRRDLDRVGELLRYENAVRNDVQGSFRCDQRGRQEFQGGESATLIAFFALVYSVEL